LVRLPPAEDFALDRLDPVGIYFEYDGERIPGVPVFDSPSTSAEGIAGILARACRWAGDHRRSRAVAFTTGYADQG